MKLAHIQKQQNIKHKQYSIGGIKQNKICERMQCVLSKWILQCVYLEERDHNSKLMGPH